MKSVLLAFTLFILSQSLVAQQRHTIKLTPLKNEEVVKYDTEDATIVFRKNDIINFSDGNIPEKESAALDFVKKSTKTVHLKTTNKRATENEQVLRQLIQDKLALKLLLGGSVEIIRISDKKKQETIFYESEDASQGKIPYHFLFNDGRPFLTTYSQPNVPLTSIGTTSIEVTEDVIIDDVVFEEPVEIKTSDEDKIFTIVEESPTPLGGMTAYYEYMSKNLKYPSIAKKAKLEGTSFVGFVVQTDGSLTDLSVIKGLSTECDQEAIRLIKEGPKWKAGKQNGKPQKVRFVLPVKFKLDAQK